MKKIEIKNRIEALFLKMNETKELIKKAQAKHDKLSDEIKVEKIILNNMLK